MMIDVGNGEEIAGADEPIGHALGKGVDPAAMTHQHDGRPTRLAHGNVKRDVPSYCSAHGVLR
jgi:hypothetical protein